MIRRFTACAQRLLGRVPSSFARFEVEQALDDPSRARAQAGGSFRQAPRRSPIARAQCLIKEPAKSEKLRLGAIEHRRKELLGRHLVAPELGCLGRQEEGQRRIGEQGVGAARTAPRLVWIACGNRDHALGERAVTGAPATLAPMPQERTRAAENQGHEPEEQSDRQPCQHRGGGEHADRGLHLPALPRNLDLPRMVGEKNRGGDQPRDDEKAEKAADHDRVLAFSDGSSGALGGAAAGGLPSRAISSSWR